MYTVEFYETRDGQCPVWEFITKHLEDGIWELRPGNNRVFYFFMKTTHLYYSTSSVKNHKKHQNVKLKKQKANESVTLAERSMTNHENME